MSAIEQAQSYRFILSDGEHEFEYHYSGAHKSMSWSNAFLPGTKLSAQIIAYDENDNPLARTLRTEISFEYPEVSFNIATARLSLTKEESFILYASGSSEGTIRFYAQQEISKDRGDAFSYSLGQCYAVSQGASILNTNLGSAGNYAVYAVDSQGRFSNWLSLSVSAKGDCPMPKEIQLNGQKVGKLQKLEGGTVSMTLPGADQQTVYSASLSYYSKGEPYYTYFTFEDDEYFPGYGYIHRFTLPESISQLSVYINGYKAGYINGSMHDEYHYIGDDLLIIENLRVDGKRVGTSVDVKAYSQLYIKFEPVEGAWRYKAYFGDCEEYVYPNGFSLVVLDQDVDVRLEAIGDENEILAVRKFSIHVTDVEPDFVITPDTTTIPYGGSVQLTTSVPLGRRPSVNWVQKDLSDRWLHSYWSDDCSGNTLTVPENTIKEDSILWVEMVDGRRSNTIEITVENSKGKLKAPSVYLDGENITHYRSTSALVRHTLTFEQVLHASHYALWVEEYDKNGSYISREYQEGTYDEVNGFSFEVPRLTAYVKFSIQAHGVGYESLYWTGNRILIDDPVCESYRFDREQHYALDTHGNVLWTEEHIAQCDKLTTCTVCGASDVTIPDIEHIGERMTEPVDNHFHHEFCSVCNMEMHRELHHSECTEPDFCNACGATGVSGGHIQHDPGEMQYNDSIHYRICNACGKQIEFETHRADCSAPNECLSCGAENVTMEWILHSYSAVNYDERYHWDVCTACGQEEEYRWLHRVSCQDKSICLVCGYVDPVDYNLDHDLDYEEEWYSDDSGHWQICEECGEKVCYGPHEIDCNQTKCLLCGYSGEYNRFVCHFSPDYQDFESYEHNESIHWFTCTGCGTIVKDSHYVTCYEPGVCHVCRAEIVSDDETIHHTMRQSSTGYACVYCGWQYSGEAHVHIWGCEEVGRYNYQCNICGKIADDDDDLSTAIPHGMIYYDREQHYQYCPRAGSEEHVFGNPHEFADGICAFCGYVKPFDPSQLEEHNILRLPVSLTVICSEAFAGVDADTVYFSAGCTSIESRAFADSKIISVHIPADNCAIADDAFEGCGRVYIYCAEDSEVAAWCDRNDILHGTETNE